LTFKNTISTELDTYYECFLQIESEKNCFKVKYEDLQQQYEELRERLESLEAVSQSEECEEPAKPKETQSKFPPIDEEVEKISNQHIDQELLYVEELATETFNKEKRRSQMLLNSKPAIDPAVLVDYKSENATLQRQVEELEVEKKMLETKNTNIEASLARWIFRACNDNTECTKLKEKITEIEKEKEALVTDMQQLRTDRDNSLKLFKLNQANLDSTKQILAEANAQLEKTSVVNSALELKNMELMDRLAVLENRNTCDVTVQTECVDTASAYSQTEAAVTSSSKLNDLASSSSSTGHVANIAAKFNGRVANATSPVSAGSGCVDIDTAGLQNELKSVRHKNDHLILEKHALKSRNDELAQENAVLQARLEELGRESAELANYITTTIENNDQAEELKTPAAVGGKRMVTTTGQQTSHSQLKRSAVTAMTTQTSSSGVGAESLWQSRLESCRSEADKGTGG